MINKKSQVWVETAVYTLIGLTIIAILLVTITPQIDKIKDKAVVKQSNDALNILDSKISEVSQLPGNIRIVDFKLSKGKLEIDGSNSSIRYILEDTNLQYSEIEKDIQEGNIFVRTEKHGSKYNVYLKMKYDNLNITFNENNMIKTLQAGATPYRLQIENIGDNAPDQKTHLNFGLM